LALQLSSVPDHRTDVAEDQSYSVGDIGVTGGRPTARRVGKVTSDPAPTIALLEPAIRPASATSVSCSGDIELET